MTGAPGSVPWLLTIATATRAVVLDAGLAVNSCVATARTLIGVLDTYGITASPAPVAAYAFNASALAGLAVGLPVSQWPTGAWSVGVEATGQINWAEKRWNGHLIVDTGARLIDAAADMFDRPMKGLRVTGPVVGRKPVGWEGGTRCTTHLHRDNVTLSWTRVEDDGWMVTPDWEGYEDRHIALVEQAVARLRRAGMPGGSETRNAAP